MRMECRDLGREVTDLAVGAGVLEDRAEDRRGVQIIGVADDDFNAQRGGAGFHDGNVLRVAVFVDEEGFGF